MYYSDLGLSFGGFDYTDAARKFAMMKFAVVEPGSNSRNAVVQLGFAGETRNVTLDSSTGAMGLFDTLSSIMNNKKRGYVGVFSRTGAVIVEKYFQPPAVDSGPAKPPAADSGPTRPVLTGGSVDSGPDKQPPGKIGGRASSSPKSLLPWILLGAGAIGLAFYTSRKP